MESDVDEPEHEVDHTECDGDDRERPTAGDPGADLPKRGDAKADRDDAKESKDDERHRREHEGDDRRAREWRTLSPG